MLIGEDFPKIDFQPFGLDLVEPNAMLGDLIIALVSWYFAYRVSKMPSTPFFRCWKSFFIVLLFSIATLFSKRNAKIEMFVTTSKHFQEVFAHQQHLP